MPENTEKQQHIICPFCCHRFHPNQAHFRLAGSERVLDEKLLNYYQNILQLESVDAKTNAKQHKTATLEDKGVSYREEDIDQYGFALQITVDKGSATETSDKRLCPNCHNDLPIGYGMRETLLISILGDARSGKSVFLTMLITELENNNDFASKLTFIGDKEAGDNFYNTYQKPLLKEQTLISSTKRKKVPPYAFNYWYQYRNEQGEVQENTVDIIFYDIAGEDLRDDAGIRSNGFNIKDSSGLIFLIDPTSFGKLSDIFQFSDLALIDAIPEENSNQAIFNTLYNYFIGLARDKSDIPLALAISKSDLFRYINLGFFNDKPESRIQNILPDEKHKGALDMSSLRGLNEEVRELISYLDEDIILNNAIGCFKNVSCFALSSLGKKPMVEQISDPVTNEAIEKGFVDGPLMPFRVKDPFYWILMRHGLLLKHEYGRYYGNNSPPPVDNPGVVQKITGIFARLFKGK